MKVDLLEICGGKAGTSQIAFRRGLSSGGNVDLTTGCDLGDPEVPKAVIHYLKTCNVLVVFLQPNCRTVGRLASFNSVMHHDTWRKHHEEDLPHLKFCAIVALLQIELGRYFLREQPNGTRLSEIDPWPQVHEDPAVLSITMDQCMAGCRDPVTGFYVKKSTQWLANNDELLRPLETYQCDRSHQHAHPTGKALESLKVYPWQICDAVVTGIERLKKKCSKTRQP